jgi:hypothetical protein
MKDKSREIDPAPEGLVDSLLVRIRLIFRLMSDPRVSPMAKLLPLGTLIYLFVPDIFPGPVDDALVFWLGNVFFVELCPPEVVQEHLDDLRNTIPAEWRDPLEEDIIDADVKDLD